MTIKDIAEAAQSLVDYCARKGEGADLQIIEGALKQAGERLTLLQMERLEGVVEAVDQLELELAGEMVTK